MKIFIMVKSKTDHRKHRVISIDKINHSVTCNCDGFNGVICSHIDAVICHKETAMILDGQEKVMALVHDFISKNKIEFNDPDWKASWKRQRRWRGLTVKKIEDRVICNIDYSKPIVCFTGKLHAHRKELIEEAKSLGWETLNSPSPNTTILVAEDVEAKTAKIMKAKECGTIIISGEQWIDMLKEI